MTNTLQFFIESGKLYVMKEVPEKPKYGFTRDIKTTIRNRELETQYNATLQKAKQSAIEVDNNDEVKQAIYDADPSRNTGVETYFRDGEIYSLEGCKMELMDWQHARILSTGNSHKTMPLKGQCALITFEEPKKEESQEDMLGEILANYREHQYYQKNNESFDNENSFIKSELENFTITRKKQ